MPSLISSSLMKVSSKPRTVAPRGCQTDLELVLEETADAVEGTLRFNRDLFDADTMHRLLRHYQTLLAGAAADPDSRIAELPWLNGKHSRIFMRKDL